MKEADILKSLKERGLLPSNQLVGSSNLSRRASLNKGSSQEGSFFLVCGKNSNPETIWMKRLIEINSH